MNNQKSRILSEKKGNPSDSPNTELARAEAAGRVMSLPRFHRSEFLIKESVKDVLCWFKSVVIFKYVKHELYSQYK